MSDIIKREDLSITPQTVNGHQEEYVYVEVERDTLDFQRYFQIVRKYKWMILALVVTAVTLAVLCSVELRVPYRKAGSAFLWRGAGTESSIIRAMR